MLVLPLAIMKSMIKALQNSLGVLTDDPEVLKGMVQDFYKTLYTSEGVHNKRKFVGTRRCRSTTSKKKIAAVDQRRDPTEIG